MRYIVFVFALSVSMLSWSQELNFVFKGTVENSDMGKREAGVTISVVQNGSSIFSTSSASSGKYSLRGSIKYSSPFEVVFSKNGLVSKKVRFDLSKMHEEDAPPGDFKPVEALDMTMFKERDNVDFSFLDSQPVADFDWNTRDMSVRLDAVESNKIRTKIQDLLNNAEKDKAEAEAKYQAAISAADAFYNQEKYEEALEKYEEATSIKPKEQYPIDRILELDALIQAQKKEELEAQQEDMDYNNLIAAADNLRDQDKLESAISKYQEALTKKDEQYPKDQIATLQKTIADRKKEAENQAKYDAAIKTADGFMKQNSLRAARDKYTEASKLKPSEQYPKDKLAEIAKKLEAQAEQEETQKKYDEAVAAGDQLFSEEKYAEAKEKYQEALTYEASATYPKGRIGLCDEKLAAEQAEKERLEKIAQLLATGNEQITNAEWEPAKASFTEVLGLEEGHPEATEKLALIEQKIKEANDQALQEEKYNKLMEEGDNEDAAGKLAEALGKYEEAKSIKSTPEVDTKIADVKSRLADQEALAAKEEEYAKHMSEGESMLGIIGDIEGARAEFEKALALFPDRQPPKDKIAEIDKLLAAQQDAQAKKEAYEAAIAEADGMFASEKYEDAKAKYVEAQGIDDTQTYPGEKITEIDGILAAQQDEQAKKEAYEAAIAEADGLFTSKKYEDAKAKYVEAQGIDNTQTYPGERITEIDGILAAQQDEQAKKEAYEAAIAEADGLFASEKYEDAKAKYVEAQGIDATQTYPGEKIVEIDGILAAQQDEQAKKEAYEAAIAEADGYFNSEKYEDAKAKYEEAQGIDAAQTYPGERINEINGILAAQQDEQAKKEAYEAAIAEADGFFNSEKYEDAKAKYTEAQGIDNAQTYPGERIAEIDGILASKLDEQAKKEAYEAAIAEADGLFNSEKYQDAKGKYIEAQGIDNTQTYPGERISEIDGILASLQDEQAKKEAYEAAIAEADGFFNSEKYEDAKAKYVAAQGIDNTQTYPGEKIAEIDRLLADQASEEAVKAQIAQLLSEGNTLYGQTNLEGAKSKFEEVLSLDAGNAEATEMLSKINADIAASANEAEQEAKYNDLITQAQSKENASDYTGAIEKYNEALGVKPGEQLPKDKIAELQALMNNAAEQAEIDRKYREFIDKGDQLVENKDYLEAIKQYNNALALKPGEQEPVDKAAAAEELARNVSDVDEQYEKILTVAQKKIDEEAFTRAIELLERAIGLKERDDRPKEMLKEAKRLQANKNAYTALMKQGDDLAGSKKYADAKSKYEEALSKRPSESEPSEKIAEMDRLIAEQSSAAQTEALYQEYMTKGSVAQGTKNYQQALGHYQSALSVKPGDVNAQNKINEIQQILDDIANANAEDLDRKNKFNALVKKADGEFSAEYYLQAKNTYEEALAIDPSSSYALTQRDECIRLERLKGVEEAEREYRKIITAADKNFDTQTWDKAKGYYERALTIKRDDPYPKIKLAEIDAILNPVITDSPELEDLGDPYDNSIMDGMALLQKAEAERKLVKGQKIGNVQSGIKDAEVEMTTVKTKDHYDNSQKIYEVYQGISADATESDLDRQKNLEILRESKRELADDARTNISYEYSENLGDQEVLYRVNDEVALDYGERHSVYQDNTAVMKQYNTALADEMSTDAYNDYKLNIGSDQQLTDVKLKIDQGIRDDYAERALVERDVTNARNYAIDAHTEASDARYGIQINNKAVVNDVNRVVAEKVIIDTEIPHDNNQELVSVRNDIKDENIEQLATEQAHIYKVDAEIADVRERVIADGQDLDGNRIASNEALKQSKKELKDAEMARYNAEMDKYVTNKGFIEEKVVENAEIKVLADASHAKKIAYVEAMDKKAHISSVEGLEGDEAERLAAKKKIESVYANVNNHTTEEVKKTEQNAVDLADVNKTIVAQDNAKLINEQDKRYDARDKISKITNTPKEKEKVGNALGEEYPEGVSQESFTRSDDDGLMTTIITRRIVVIDGHADVYVRTQTINGITYSKNGKPSLSHVWNRETQDPKLERHY